MKKRLRHVLVADDDPVYRDVASAALEEAGFKVTAVNDGGEAIAALKSAQFDIAIVDLTMPVADGVTVIESSRAEGPNIHTPIIVITGHDDASAVDGAYKAGATSFLTKPLNWLLFTPHVEFVLRSGQVESELRAANAAAAFLSDLKSQMMSALAREFQAPIKTIFGFSELIRKQVYGPLTPQMYGEMAVDMGLGAQQLNASLLKLMDFGKTLTKQLEIKAEEISISDLVNQSLSALGAKAERRGVILKTQVNIPDGATVNADPGLLSQAVRSLMDNAIRLSPRGAVVEINAGLAADGAFSVWTTDRGPPIPAELLAEFNTRAVNRTSVMAQSESRDVGIRIAKILTEAHQGSLEIKSDPGGGNLVRLEIPKERCVAPRVTLEPTLASADRLAVIGDELTHELRLRASPAPMRSEMRSQTSFSARQTPPMPPLSFGKNSK